MKWVADQHIKFLLSKFYSIITACSELWKVVFGNAERISAKFTRTDMFGPSLR